MAKIHINLDTEIGSTGITIGELLKSLQDLSNGTGITLTGNLNKINLFADKNNWLCQPLKNLKANKVMDMSYVYPNSDNAAQFCLAEKDGKMYPYTDGFFYQNEGNYKCVDTSCGQLLWEDNQPTAGEFVATLNDDYYNYDLIIICTSHGTFILHKSYMSANMTHCGWDGNYNGDRVWDKGVWMDDSRHMHFTRTFGRGLNGYTGADYCDNVLKPMYIYGFRFTI